MTPSVEETRRRNNAEEMRRRRVKRDRELGIIRTDEIVVQEEVKETRAEGEFQRRFLSNGDLMTKHWHIPRSIKATPRDLDTPLLPSTAHTSGEATNPPLLPAIPNPATAVGSATAFLTHLAQEINLTRRQQQRAHHLAFGAQPHLGDTAAQLSYLLHTSDPLPARWHRAGGSSDPGLALPPQTSAGAGKPSSSRGSPRHGRLLHMTTTPTSSCSTAPSSANPSRMHTPYAPTATPANMSMELPLGTLLAPVLFVAAGDEQHQPLAGGFAVAEPEESTPRPMEASPPARPAAAVAAAAELTPRSHLKVQDGEAIMLSELLLHSVRCLHPVHCQCFLSRSSAVLLLHSVPELSRFAAALSPMPWLLRQQQSTCTMGMMVLRGGVRRCRCMLMPLAGGEGGIIWKTTAHPQTGHTRPYARHSLAVSSAGQTRAHIDGIYTPIRTTRARISTHLHGTSARMRASVVCADVSCSLTHTHMQAAMHATRLCVGPGHPKVC